MTTAFPLTIEDVRAFLATKGNSDIVGYPVNAMFCLLANTLNWRYPDCAWRVDLNQYSNVSGYRRRFSDDLEILRRAFDFGIHLNDPITKGDLRQHEEFSIVLETEETMPR